MMAIAVPTDNNHDRIIIIFIILEVALMIICSKTRQIDIFENPEQLAHRSPMRFPHS
jgi:hypothetical protein